MFSHDAKASRMRDRAADSLCVQPEFSAPAPRGKELPLHTALPRRFESATMQRHSPDPDSGQKPDSYDEAHHRAFVRDARPAERRVGAGWVSTGGSRGSAVNEK